MAVGIGRAAGWLGRGVRRAGQATGEAAADVGRWAGRGTVNSIPDNPGIFIGAAAGVGVLSGVFNRDSVYRREIFPSIQESTFGDPNALNNMIRANIWATMNSNEDEVRAPSDYLYGQNINFREMAARRSAARGNPVSGQVVFGMYNMR